MYMKTILYVQQVVSDIYKKRDAEGLGARKIKVSDDDAITDGSDRQ